MRVPKKIETTWKANVTPMSKITNPSIFHFRAIPLPTKVLESFFLSTVKESLIDGYGPKQFGFLPGFLTLLVWVCTHLNSRLCHQAVRHVLKPQCCIDCFWLEESFWFSLTLSHSLSKISERFHAMALEFPSGQIINSNL